MSLFFLFAAFIVPFLIHLYVWIRVVRAPRWPRWAFRTMTVALIAAYVSAPITFELRLLAPGFSKTVSWFTLPWLALVGLLAVVVGFTDLAHLAIRLGRRVAKRPAALPAAGFDLSRRRFLAGATTTVAGASMAGGIVSARGEHEIVDVEVKLAKLPKSMDGFSIVQLSDLHVGMTIDRAFVQRVVDRANALQPDLIALTGDIVDGPVAELADDVAPLAGLRAKHGVFGVTGNHEYYAGAEEWIAALEKLGVRYLRNQRVAIDNATSTGEGFDLAGIYDDSGYRYDHAPNMRVATAGRDPSRALVVLAHQPRQIRDVSRFGADLQLSGHTHGGQIWPWHYLVKIQQGGLLAGRYQIGDTQLYVTRGCGYWGPPVRLLAPLEITRVVLRAA